MSDNQVPVGLLTRGETWQRKASLDARSPWLWGVPLFSLFAMLVILLANVNESLFLVINTLSRYTGDMVWANITIFGDTLVVLVLLLPFTGRRPDIVWSVLLAAFFATLLVNGSKELFEAPRPPVVLDPESIHIIGSRLRLGSFPSGHSTAIFTLAAVFCLRTRLSSVALALLPLALVISLSRVVVGVHWPLDVLGGALAGWLAGICGVWLGDRWSWGTGRSARLIVSLVLMVCAAWLFVYDTGYPQAKALQQLVVVVCLIFGGFNLAGIIRSKV